MKADHTYVALSGNIGDWVNEFDPNTTSGASPASGTPGDWAMPQGQRALHWAGYQHDLPAGLIGAVVVYEARGDGIMVNAGMDNINADTSVNGDLFISKYKRTDPVLWTHVGGSSITAALLRQYPPPL
jgi:hypothetical protein